MPGFRRIGARQQAALQALEIELLAIVETRLARPSRPKKFSDRIAIRVPVLHATVVGPVLAQKPLVLSRKSRSLDPPLIPHQHRPAARLQNARNSARARAGSNQ